MFIATKFQKDLSIFLEDITFFSWDVSLARSPGIYSNMNYDREKSPLSASMTAQGQEERVERVLYKLVSLVHL